MEAFILALLTKIGAWNSPIALMTYWAPLVLCLFGYASKIYEEIKQDIKKRETYESYSPSVTVGTIVGYFLASVIPVVNLFAAVFSAGPRMFGRFFKAIGAMIDIPIIPKKK